jgi:Flp pilus assembly pilin Flp
MQDLFIRAYLWGGDIRDSLSHPLRNERGQATAEYVAVILLLVAVVTTLISFGPEIAESIKNVIKGAIDQIGGS